MCPIIIEYFDTIEEFYGEDLSFEKEESEKEESFHEPPKVVHFV